MKAIKEVCQRLKLKNCHETYIFTKLCHETTSTEIINKKYVINYHRGTCLQGLETDEEV